jgi:hypothetical protein
MLAVRRETMLVVWFRASSGARNSFEGSVDVREIKEIRLESVSYLIIMSSFSSFRKAQLVFQFVSLILI